MLRIGFDAKRLFNNYTGLGNYSRTLVANLQSTFPQNDYFLYTTKTRANAETNQFLNGNFSVVEPRTSFKNFWRTFSIIKDLRKSDINIYHGLSHEIPVGLNKTDISSIVTIHDLIYKFQPKDFSFIDRKIYDWKFRYACKNADRIIAISHSTKNDIIEHYSISPSKIEVVYQSCSDIFRNSVSVEQKNTVAKKYELPGQYLLYVGSIIERKNLLNLLKAVNQIKSFIKIPLIVVGNGKNYKKKCLEYIRINKLEDHVKFLHKVEYTDLPAIYSMSKIFIYPSFYEGFGIPIIEALWTKTPVITSRLSSLPEAAGSGAHYIDPNNSADIADGIVRLLTNKEYYIQLMNNGFSHVRKFSSEQTTKDLMEVYEKVLRDK